MRDKKRRTKANPISTITLSQRQNDQNWHGTQEQNEMKETMKETPTSEAVMAGHCKPNPFDVCFPTCVHTVEIASPGQNVNQGVTLVT